MKPTPRVSIVMPAFNAAKTIAASIESLQRQTYRDFELIVIDDGSTDNTYDIVQHISHLDSRIVLLQQVNSGQGAARNKGIDCAKGDYIGFLDSDDYATFDRLESQLIYMEEHVDISVLGGGRENITKDGKVLGCFFSKLTHDLLISNIVTNCPFTTSTVLGRAGVFKTYKFDPSAIPCEDHDLWIRLSYNPRIKFSNLEKILVKYTTRDRVGFYSYYKIFKMRARHFRRIGVNPYLKFATYKPFFGYLKREFFGFSD